MNIRTAHYNQFIWFSGENAQYLTKYQIISTMANVSHSFDTGNQTSIIEKGGSATLPIGNPNTCSNFHVSLDFDVAKYSIG